MAQSFSPPPAGTAAPPRPEGAAALDPRHVVILGALREEERVSDLVGTPAAARRGPRHAQSRARGATRRPGGLVDPNVLPPHLRRRRRRRSPWPIALLAVISLTTAMVLDVLRPVPAPALHLRPPAARVVDGTAPALPWPTAGEAAVSVAGTGVRLQSGSEQPVPVASLAKVMTAYLVLHDHPISPTDQGPTLTMTAVDQQDAGWDASVNATGLPLAVGQHWTERQLLDALVVHSANDVADTLARWDSGSVAAFVARMNTTAGALGMAQTHYADPSGIDDTGTSTAADQLRITEAAMAIPTFAAVADQHAITLPIVGTLANYVPAVGSNGVVGVKSGFTQAAMGCVVLAVKRQSAAGPVLVLVALTGQQGGVDPIRAADARAVALADAVAGGLRRTTVLASGTVLGTLSAPWARSAAQLVSSSGVSAVVWPGEALSYRLRVQAPRRSVARGAEVGTVVVEEGSGQVTVPVVTRSSIPAVSLHWRMTHR